jgi:hypothetical protein
MWVAANSQVSYWNRHGRLARERFRLECATDSLQAAMTTNIPPFLFLANFTERTGPIARNDTWIGLFWGMDDRWQGKSRGSHSSLRLRIPTSVALSIPLIGSFTSDRLT